MAAAYSNTFYPEKTPSAREVEMVTRRVSANATEQDLQLGRVFSPLFEGFPLGSVFKLVFILFWRSNTVFALFLFALLLL